MTCFHCTSGTCSCLICSGKCLACSGRAKTRRELDLAASYRLDVRNIADWELFHNGVKAQRRLKFPAVVYA